MSKKINKVVCYQTLLNLIFLFNIFKPYYYKGFKFLEQKKQ